MTTQQQTFLSALSGALNRSIKTTDPAVLQEAKEQAVYALMTTDSYSYSIVANNTQLAWEQQELANALKNIPYVVLKGTAAAIYYPEPLRRTLGDIDLVVAPEDFPKAYQALKDAGYNTPDSVDGLDRHVHFFRNDITIELHRNFAVLQTREQEELLDQWIMDAIPHAVQGKVASFTFPMLPDQLNGLVILAHINQHLEEGLGIRQIVDWAMYIKHSLSDEAWADFREKTDLLGLTTLAKASAQLGRKHLGLNEEITWCRDVPDSVVADLVDYLFECGNFGHKDAVNNTVAMVLSHGRGVRGFFSNLQSSGESNWALLGKKPWLKPFAWAYQLGRYIRLGFKNTSVMDFGKNMAASGRRNKLLDSLEARRQAFRTKRPKKSKTMYDRLRTVYRWLKKSIFRKPLYYLHDAYYLVAYKHMGKAKISPDNIRNVEENVTFIYKSFNRQKQAKRLYRNIKQYYPNARVIIADDSKDPLSIQKMCGRDMIVRLPFNSGLSKGIIQALEQVETPYVMRMDDDELLIPRTNVHDLLAYLQKNRQVDLVGIQASHKNPEQSAEKMRKIRMNKKLLIPAGTIIDGKETVYKSVNVFLARTESLRKVGYDPNIRMIDHHEFFFRAAGQIVCVQDAHCCVMHCHNRFEKDYDKYRSDCEGDARYIQSKHGGSYG